MQQDIDACDMYITIKLFDDTLLFIGKAVERKLKAIVAPPLPRMLVLYTEMNMIGKIP